MNKYSGQALAIVFVLLIVGSIIGFALYARMIRESERVVDERASTEANELAETIVGLIGTLDYTQVKDNDVLEELDCLHEFPFSCRVHGLSLNELEEVLDVMGLEDLDFSRFEDEYVEDYCLTELALSSLSEEGVTIEKDDVYSVFLSNADNLADCVLEFSMDDLDSSTSGFVMSQLYVERDGDSIASYKAYEFNDVIGFLYNYTDEQNWESYNLKPKLTFSSEGTYSLIKELEGVSYDLDEVRFKSLGGSSKLSWNSSGSCNLGDHLLVEVGATCGGQYVGKNFILPEEYFSPPMFDYVYFQGRGDLTPGSSE